jgi:hypothetical protein
VAGARPARLALMRIEGDLMIFLRLRMREGERVRARCVFFFIIKILDCVYWVALLLPKDGDIK